MKIAINCSFYFPKGGGIKEYIYNLVLNLNNIIAANDELLCYIPKDHVDYWRETMPSTIRSITTPYSSKQPIKRSLFQQRFWLKQEKTEKFDIFHSPFFYAPYFKKTPVLLTVHDMRFMSYPASYSFLRLLYLKYKVPRSLKQANSIIAISQFTKDEIIEHCKIPSENINVIHEAVNKGNFNSNKAKYTKLLKQNGLCTGNYLLAVGHIEPRKNYERLIDAFNLLIRDKKLNLKLVIVGKENFKASKTLGKVAGNNRVVHLGWVQFAELIWLYANCKFHVFPSYYEGFGFPILEAASFSKVTVGSNVSSIPEIAGNGGIYFDPFSVDNICSTLKKAIDNGSLLQEKCQATLTNMKKFSWNENANRTYQLYKSVKIK